MKQLEDSTQTLGDEAKKQSQGNLNTHSKLGHGMKQPWDPSITAKGAKAAFNQSAHIVTKPWIG